MKGKTKVKLVFWGGFCIAVSGVYSLFNFGVAAIVAGLFMVAMGVLFATAPSVADDE